MNTIVQKMLARLGSVELLRKHDLLTPEYARKVIAEPVQTLEKLEQADALSKSLYGPFGRPDRDVDGLFKFAYARNIPVGLRPEECHVLVAGQTGCGKSTLIKVLFSQVLGFARVYSAPFIAWMFAKADDLRPLLLVNRDITVVRFRPDEVKLNPLEPPRGIGTAEWASIFVDFFNQALGLMGATRALLIESLSILYEAYGKHGHYPSLNDLYIYIKNQKYPGFSRTARYQESLVNRLTGLLHGPLGKVFDCSRGHINALTEMNAIFEVQHLTTEQEVFMVNYFVSYLFHKKLANKANVRHFVAVDDANAIFDASYEKRPEYGLPVIHHLLTTVRKSLINMFVLTQTPHQIGASILSNSFAKIMFSLSNGKDIEFMRTCMGIKEPAQIEHCYGLAPREAVIKFSSRYPAPFVAQVPKISFGDMQVHDRFIALNNTRLLSGLKIQPGFKPTCSCSGEKSTTEKVSSTQCGLTERRAKEVLLDIYNRPFLTNTQRSKDLRLSAETSTKVYKFLEKMGYADFLKINLTARRGGLATHQVITKKGYELIDKKPPKQSGGTGPLHWFIEHYLAHELPAKGFKDVVVEKNLNNKRIDVFGIYDGLKVGVEVSCSTTELSNISKDWDACDRIIIVTPDKKNKERVLRELEGKIEGGKVTVCMVSELLNNTEGVIEKR